MIDGAIYNAVYRFAAGSSTNNNNTRAPVVYRVSSSSKRPGNEIVHDNWALRDFSRILRLPAACLVSSAHATITIVSSGGQMTLSWGDGG